MEQIELTKKEVTKLNEKTVEQLRQMINDARNAASRKTNARLVETSRELRNLKKLHKQEESQSKSISKSWSESNDKHKKEKRTIDNQK